MTRPPFTPRSEGPGLLTLGVSLIASYFLLLLLVLRGFSGPADDAPRAHTAGTHHGYRPMRSHLH